MIADHIYIQFNLLNLFKFIYYFVFMFCCQAAASGGCIWVSLAANLKQVSLAEGECVWWEANRFSTVPCVLTTPSFGLLFSEQYSELLSVFCYLLFWINVKVKAKEGLDAEVCLPLETT